MTKEQAQRWMERWKVVEERQAQELREATYEERFRSLAVLMDSASHFDFRLLDEEDAAARERWARLQTLLSNR